MSRKLKYLLYSLLFDAIGMLSFTIPGFGEFSDIIWAPISAYLVLKMYKSNVGKVGSLISFGEEIGFVGTDVVPTFTLVWIYEFYIKKYFEKKKTIKN